MYEITINKLIPKTVSLKLRDIIFLFIKIYSMLLSNVPFVP